jgi:hypothetical protein
MSSKSSVTPEQTPFEIQLQALGRILDRRPNPIRDLCILQAGEGFVVQLLEGVSSYDAYDYAPATIVIEPAELTAAIDEVAGATKASTGSWWKRR